MSLDLDNSSTDVTASGLGPQAPIISPLDLFLGFMVISQRNAARAEAMACPNSVPLMSLHDHLANIQLVCRVSESRVASIRHGIDLAACQ